MGIHYSKKTTAPLFLLFLIFLQACVSIPKKEMDEKLSSTLSFSQSLTQALATSDFKEGNWPSANWWEVFHDVQLNHLVRTALKDSPTIKKAETRVQLACQIAKEKRSYLFPNLDVDAEDNWQYLSKNGFFRAFTPVIPGNINDVTFSLNFSYEIDFWGKNFNIFKATLGYAKAQEAEKAQAVLILSTSVAQTYFQIQTNQAKLKILNETKDARVAQYNLVQKRQHFGLDTNIQKFEAKKDVLEIQNIILNLEKEITVEKHLLKALLGQNPDGEDFLEISQIAFNEPFPLPENLSSDLLARRPDLMALIWRVEATAHEIGAAKADFYPNVNLMAFAGLESVFFHKLFSLQSKMGSLHPAIHLPIFTAGRLKANLEARRAEFEEAIAAYHETLLQAAKEVVDQITIFKTVNNEIRIQELTVSNIEASFNLMFDRFIEGVSNYSDVLDKEQTLLGTRFQMVDLYYSRLISIVNLMKALGGGYQSDYLLISQKEGAGNG